MASSILISVDNHYLAVLMSIALLFLLLFSSQQDCNLKSLALLFFFLTNFDKSLKLEVMSDKIIQRQVF